MVTVQGANKRIIFSLVALCNVLPGVIAANPTVRGTTRTFASMDNIIDKLAPPPPSPPSTSPSPPPRALQQCPDQGRDYPGCATIHSTYQCQDRVGAELCAQNPACHCSACTSCCAGFQLQQGAFGGHCVAE